MKFIPRVQDDEVNDAGVYLVRRVDAALSMAAAHVGGLVTPVSSAPTASPGISVFAPWELPNVTRVDRSRSILNKSGSINDNTIQDHVENEFIDDEYESDGPPGIVDSSSEEELWKLGSENEDDIVDPIYFIGWRNDG